MVYPKEKIEELQHRWTTPHGKRLIKMIKESKCYLSPVLFRQKVKRFTGINDEEVVDAIDLRGAPLAGFDFRVPVQADDDGFTEDVAILSNIHFEGAILRHTTFEEGKIHDCFFEGADLAHSEFKSATLNNCNFQESDCTGINFHGAKLINCNFHEAVIRDMVTTAAIVDQQTTFGKILKAEREESYHFAAIQYKQIKELYKGSSLHNEADHYHYKKMVAKRKITSPKSPMRWLNYFFGDLLCKYGTSFGRVLIAAAIVILGCAALYTINHSLLFHNEPVTNPTYWTSLYFSIVTFTTLGYGDYHAIDSMRYIAATEALIGAALMALFTVIAARNIIRD